MTIQIPRTLTTEHEALHQRLVQATHLEGATGEAAREVARRLHPHFVKEEVYALPPLGLLAALTERGRDADVADMAEVLPMTRQLEAELGQMLAEHREIVTALAVLRAAAETEQQAEVVAFADALEAHAQIEEQVMYPAAILVGRYVSQALAMRAARTSFETSSA